MVFLGAIHYKRKQEGHIVNKTAYRVIGIDPDGGKDVLGMYNRPNCFRNQRTL